MNDRAIDLSVIVASYETRTETLACLAAVERAGAARPDRVLETIVVDNGSRDASAEAIARVHPGVRLFPLARNRGFAAAINIGLRAARGRHVLLLNSDALLEPDVPARAIDLLDARADVGVIGVGLIHSDGRAQRSVHPLPGWSSELVPEWLLRLVRPRAYSVPDTETGTGRNEIVDVEAVRGAALLVRGELLASVGLLDEGYFFFLEDTDYCRRVRAAGHRVVHAPGLRVRHRLGASSKRRAPLTTRIEYHRSLYRYLARTRSHPAAVVAACVRAVRTSLSLLGLLLGAPFSQRVRARFAERRGLLLWHLRGCPAAPSLATAGPRSRACVE